MLSIVGIDPGTERSAIVQYNVLPGKTVGHVEWARYLDNAELAHLFPLLSCGTVGVIEDVRSFYRRVGSDLLTTVKWIGVFCWEWRRQRGDDMHCILRATVKTHLIGGAVGDDADVTAALYEKFGGSRSAAVGTIKAKGPCHGVTGHAWNALAAALAWYEINLPDLERTRFFDGRDVPREDE